jgi:long-chain acyl-CoA synthetase
MGILAKEISKAMQQNFVEYIERSIRDHWDLPAFSDYQGPTLSYGEVAERIYRLHALFKETGLSRGDKVGLLGRNSSNWGITYLAAVSYGATIVPILPDFHPADCENIVRHSDSVLLFTSEAFLARLDRSKLGELKAVFSLADFRLLHAKDESALAAAQSRVDAFFDSAYRSRLASTAFSFDPVSEDELAAIVYTSGTTGFSKGVMLSHKNLISNLVYARKMMPLKMKDTILSFLPLAHMFGNAFEFIFPFSVGCHITFLGKMPTTNLLIEAFAAVKPRMILSVPLVIEKIYYKQIKPMIESPKIVALAKIPLIRGFIYRAIKGKILDFFGGNVMVVIIGGASFSPEVEDFLLKIRFPFTVGYGMTECAPLICYCDWWKRSKADCGKLVDRMEMRIEGGTPSSPGEIWLRGDNLMSGYYKNPEETARAIDGEGWFHTGDLGYVATNGSVYIRGRSKTMILGASGQNIYPEEIEAKLNNLPLVAESLVLEEEGRLTALVHPDLAEAQKQGLAAEAIAEMMEQNRVALNKQLPEYGRIAKIKLQAEEFMKTPTNKIKRFLYVAKS